MKGDRLTVEQADDLLGRCNSYDRMPTLLTLSTHLEYGDWLGALGKWWSMCDNIGQYRGTLRAVMGTRGPLHRMMTTEESAAYSALPERITVYRGCSKKNIVGASWPLCETTAARFPFLMRYRAAQPLLVTASVMRANVLALKLDRGESEIITFSARRHSVVAISEPQLEVALPVSQ